MTSSREPYPRSSVRSPRHDLPAMTRRLSQATVRWTGYGMPRRRGREYVRDWWRADAVNPRLVETLRAFVPGINRRKWLEQLESLGETAEARTYDRPVLCRRDAADGIGITMVGAGRSILRHAA